VRVGNSRNDERWVAAWRRQSSERSHSERGGSVRPEMKKMIATRRYFSLH